MEISPLNLKPIETLIHHCELKTAKWELIKLMARTDPDENPKNRFEICMLLLEVLAELKDSEMISQIRLDISQRTYLIHQQHADRLNYVLALCSAFQGNFEEALFFCERSLDSLLKFSESINENSLHLDQLILTLAGQMTCLVKLSRFEEAFRTLERLDLIADRSNSINAKIAVQLNAADLLSRSGNQSQSWLRIEKALELIRSQKSLLNHIKSTIISSEILERSGKLSLALDYLRHADSLCDPQELGFRSQRIQENIFKLQKITVSNLKSDLVIESNSAFVQEKNLGKIDLGNQHLVQNLLTCLANAQGAPVSKSEICRLLWMVDYNPRIHDNKIYVSIKRLRSLIEPDPKNPRYIIRARGGYKILLDSYRFG